MKIRISQKGVRLRLSVDDVNLLRKNGVCQLILHMPMNSGFHFELQAHSSEDVLVSQIVDGRLTIFWPQNDLFLWCDDSERIGLYADIEIEGKGLMALSIEKEFACNPEDSDPKRFFPRPKTTPPC
jgi:hypothetical protein